MLLILVVHAAAQQPFFYVIATRLDIKHARYPLLDPVVANVAYDCLAPI